MKNKKLQLNKETLRNLSDESLGQVAGGKPKGNSSDCYSRVHFSFCVGIIGCIVLTDSCLCHK